MPPVTREMVSRPLESPRLAFVPCFIHCNPTARYFRFLGFAKSSAGGDWRGSDVRKIGDVDEGVVEGGEDAGNAKDELAC